MIKCSHCVNGTVTENIMRACSCVHSTGKSCGSCYNGAIFVPESRTCGFCLGSGRDEAAEIQAANRRAREERKVAQKQQRKVAAERKKSQNSNKKKLRNKAAKQSESQVGVILIFGFVGFCILGAISNHGNKIDRSSQSTIPKKEASLAEESNAQNSSIVLSQPEIVIPRSNTFNNRETSTTMTRPQPSHESMIRDAKVLRCTQLAFLIADTKWMLEAIDGVDHIMALSKKSASLYEYPFRWQQDQYLMFRTLGYHLSGGEKIRAHMYEDVEAIAKGDKTTCTTELQRLSKALLHDLAGNVDRHNERNWNHVSGGQVIAEHREMASRIYSFFNQCGPVIRRYKALSLPPEVLSLTPKLEEAIERNSQVRLEFDAMFGSRSKISNPNRSKFGDKSSSGDMSESEFIKKYLGPGWNK